MTNFFFMNMSILMQINHPMTKAATTPPSIEGGCRCSTMYQLGAAYTCGSLLSEAAMSSSVGI